MEEKKHSFIKIGNSISFKPSTDGLEYSLEPNKVYSVSIDKYTDEITFSINPSLDLPNKVYSTEEDDKFIKKVINRYNKVESGVIGVMLSGVKGCGKTITAKVIANESNLPIILIDKTFRPHQLKKLFAKLETIEVCFLFDEIDKIGEDYDDSFLLQILDGAATTGKKMMLFTCNDTDKINEYLIDRCSRIRYWKEFDTMSASMIQTVLQDRLNDKEEIKPLTDFILNNFGCISFDNVMSFVEEVNEYPEDTFETLFDDMNLSNK